MKSPGPSMEALFALIFAVCVLTALVLLTSCGAAPEAKPMMALQSMAFIPGESQSAGADRALGSTSTFGRVVDGAKSSR